MKTSMPMKAAVSALILLLKVSRLYAQTYNIVDFGAKTDSTFLNTNRKKPNYWR